MRDIFQTGLFDTNANRELLGYFIGNIGLYKRLNNSAFELYAANDGFIKMTASYADHFLVNGIETDGSKNIIELLGSAKDTTRQTAEFRLYSKDGNACFRAEAMCIPHEGETFVIVSLCDVSAQKNMELLYLFNEERFRIIFENADVNIWDYDYVTKCITQTPYSQTIHGLDIVIPDVPESLIASEYVAPESAQAFVEMHNALRNGVETASGIFRVKTPDLSSYRYESIHYTNVLDDDGKPYKAIGTSEDITEEYKIANRFEQELDYKASTGIGAFMTAVINVTKRVMYETKAKFGDETIPLGDVTFESIFADAASHVESNDNVRKAFLSFNKQKLTDSFVNGECNFVYKFSLVDGAHRHRWVQYEMHLLQEPTTNDLLLFVYCYDIDDQMRKTFEDEDNGGCDSLTGLLTRNTLCSRINGTIAHSRSSAVHALILFDLDNFSAVNNKLGRDKGDDIIVRFGNLLSSIFYTTDMVGRLGGDEFAVFLSNATQDSVEYMLEEFYDMMLEHSFSPEIQLCASVGVAMAEGNSETDCDLLFEHARIAMGKAKHNGKNKHIIFDEDDM